MKQIAQYKLNFESPWLIFSGVLMGLSFFMQAVYFLGIVKLQGLDFFMLAFHLVGPMALEFIWLLCLRGFKLNVAVVYGALGILILSLLLAQSLFFGTLWQIGFAAASLLLGSVTLILITGGFFPYKLLGFLVFAGILAFRFFVFDYSAYITPGDWAGLVLEAPALCMLGAVTAFFCGITGTRKEEPT